MEFLKDMDKDKNTSIRQEDITGDQHLFHSLPKEFQIWHNTQYILEKKSEIDESTVPDALLNAYMWKAVFDATSYSIITTIFIIASVIKVKLSPTIYGLFISLLILVPYIFWVAYHFLYYAKIKAQVVGEVTKKSAKYTADTFYSTYFAVTSSLIMAFLFIMSILDDIAYWLNNYILSFSAEPNNFFVEYFRNFLIWIYNFMVDILTPPPDNILANILYNTYFSTALFVLISITILFIFERKAYFERKEQVELEIENEEILKGYPIDRCIIKLTQWRKENGI